ncbi:MAG: type III restriction endonuclease subunit R, partial [Alphaproteobacteria bacterium PA3]
AVIAVPYQALADQWCEELEAFNINAIPCYRSLSVWHSRLSEAVERVVQKAPTFSCAVVVNQTMGSPEFQALLRRIPGESLFWIGDECHHHGSEAYSKYLPIHANFRIGLSATPEHYLDEARNNRLVEYYGPIAFRYTLQDAIRDEILTPYDYYPHPVELTTEETEEFCEIADKIAKIYASNQGSDTSGKASDGLNELYSRRARLVGGAANKLPLLKDILSNKPPVPLTLFYCSAGSSKEPNASSGGSSRRHIEAASQLLRELSWKTSAFTANESKPQRAAILEAFKNRSIDVLVAI